MTDLSQTIAPKSDQLNSDDLISGPRTIKITKVAAWNGEQPIAVNFEGDNGKPYLPCKSMRRVLVQVWGSDGNAFVGRSMTLYRDPEVIFGGVKVGGIRISHMSHMDADMVMSLTASKKARAPFKVRVLKDEPKAKPAAANTASAGLSDPEHLAFATAAARKGTDAFRTWWNTPEGVAARHVAKPAIAKLQAIAGEADKATQDDPFSLPPLDGTPTLTPEQLAQQEAALAEFRAQQEAGA